MLGKFTFIVSLQTMVNLVMYGLVAFVIILITSHLASRIISSRKKPLNLSQNSLVVITGGCLGLGRQMAIQIAKLYHCTIIIVDYRKDLFFQINSILNQQGASSQCYYCDLADDQSVINFISQLKKRKQNISLFIHNAGIHIPKRALQTTQKQFMMQYKVNFLSPVKILRQTIQLMQNGQIAVVASMTALAHGGVDVSAYSSTKYALYSYINCLRQQIKLDKLNVSVSMGCPYLVRTGMFQGFKTKLDFLFLTLDTGYVARRLVKQFVQKKEICYIYQYQSFLFRIVSLFPTIMLDYLSIKFNISNFNQIKEKHSERASKLK